MCRQKTSLIARTSLPLANRRPTINARLRPCARDCQECAGLLSSSLSICRLSIDEGLAELLPASHLEGLLLGNKLWHKRSGKRPKVCPVKSCSSYALSHLCAIVSIIWTCKPTVMTFGSSETKVCTMAIARDRYQVPPILKRNTLEVSLPIVPLHAMFAHCFEMGVSHSVVVCSLSATIRTFWIMTPFSIKTKKNSSPPFWPL
jgi:hypothetical protein